MIVLTVKKGWQHRCCPKGVRLTLSLSSVSRLIGDGGRKGRSVVMDERMAEGGEVFVGWARIHERA